jgi:hypothetical protein
MTDQTAVPAEPKTPAEEATARLAELKDAWTKNSAAAAGDKIDQAMAGTLENRIFQERAHVDNIHTAAFLRDSGVDEPAIIRQVLTGSPVSKQEFEAAQSMKSQLLKDHEFQKLYLSGDGAAVRQMTLLNIVLTRPVKSEAAA